MTVVSGEDDGSLAVGVLPHRDRFRLPVDRHDKQHGYIEMAAKWEATIKAHWPFGKDVNSLRSRPRSCQFKAQGCIQVMDLSITRPARADEIRMALGLTILPANLPTSRSHE